MTSEKESPQELAGQDTDNRDILLPRDLIEAIPEDEREEFSQKVVQYLLEVRREEHYSGPLLPAREAERWEALIPGTAARTFDLYEETQRKRLESQDRILSYAEHELQLETKQHEDSVRLTEAKLNRSSDHTRRGQYFAFVTVIMIILGGFAMIHLGHDIGGIATLLVGAASVAGIFISQLRASSVADPRPGAREQSRE